MQSLQGFSYLEFWCVQRRTPDPTHFSNTLAKLPTTKGTSLWSCTNHTTPKQQAKKGKQGPTVPFQWRQPERRAYCEERSGHEIRAEQNCCCQQGIKLLPELCVRLTSTAPPWWWFLLFTQIEIIEKNLRKTDRQTSSRTPLLTPVLLDKFSLFVLSSTGLPQRSDIDRLHSNADSLTR